MSIRYFSSSQSKVLFVLMFSIISLLNVNYNILRSARSALAVVDLGQGAISVPLFELLGAMPGSVLLVFLLTWLLNRLSMPKVFYLTLSFFCGFFLVFSIGVYPFLSNWKEGILTPSWLTVYPSLAFLIPQACSMVFFVMAELWKVALITVLFWGLINQYIPFEEAKNYYGPLMLGVSFGTVLSGPVVEFCTSDWISHCSWKQSLILLSISVALIGVCIGFLYAKLWERIKNFKHSPQTFEKKTFSLWKGIRACLNSPYLIFIAIITITDYVVYGLGEVLFLDILKQKFSAPRDYCTYMGKLSLWNGILTALSALILTPYILKSYRWVIASLITPVCFLLTEGAFIFSLCHPVLGKNIDLIVILGSAFFCLIRAAKFTLFDASKELSFVILDPMEKMHGKLVIDGMGSRIGKGCSSLLSIVFVRLCGSVLASAPLVGFIAIPAIIICIWSTVKLGDLVERKKEMQLKDLR